MVTLGRAFSGARWLVRLEIGIWRSLILWVTRRKPGQGPGVQAFPYSRDVAPIMGAFIFVYVLSVWGLLWMIGFLAGMRVFPHLLDDHGLRVRHGTTLDLRIPWEAVATVRARRGSVPTQRTPRAFVIAAREHLAARRVA